MSATMWKSTRLKFLSRLPISNGLGVSGEYDNSEWPRYVRITDIANSTKLKQDTFRSLPPEVADKARLFQNDLLFAAVGATVGKSYLHLETGDFCFAGFLARFSPNHEVSPKFISYWSQSEHFWNQINSMLVKSTIENFSASKYSNLMISIPNRSIQEKIVSKLDAMVGSIDDKIINFEKLKSLLEEKRSSLITKAVTKGLNLDVPMKATSVEWLSKIPVHWQDGIVKRFYKVDLGKMLDSNKQIGDSKPYLRAANIHWDEIKLDSVNQMSFTKKQQSHYRLKKGDLLVTEGGHTVGRSAIWYEDSECYFQNSLNRVRGNLSSEEKYLHYIMFHLKLSGYVNMISDTATFAHLTKEKLEALTIPMPPIEEQKKIISYLDDYCKKVDSSKLIIEEQIAYLKEYRTTLISAAVTGKIDFHESV